VRPVTLEEQRAYAEWDRDAGKWRVIDDGEPLPDENGAGRYWARFNDAHDHAEAINRARRDVGMDSSAEETDPYALDTQPRGWWT
jgi:hypothetical protein